MGSHDLNPVLPWEQALRRSPGKRISDNAVRVMVRFSPSLDYLNIAGSKSVVSCHLNATVAVKKKFSFHFHFMAVQRCNHYCTIYVLLPYRFVICNNTFRAIPFRSTERSVPFFDPVPFFHMCKFEQQSVIFGEIQRYGVQQLQETENPVFLFPGIQATDYY